MYKSRREGLTFIGFWILILFFYLISAAQSGPGEKRADDSKIWENKQVDVIRSIYLNEHGQNDHNNFLQIHGLYPAKLSTKITPRFSVSFLQSDVTELNGRFTPLKAANPVHLDFFLESIKSFYSPNQSKPVWDGRVYEEDNKIIIAGYSSKYNERAVAKLSDDGKILTLVDENIAGEFPLLQIPAAQIVFDPFEWRLLRVTPSAGKKIEERTLDFLPIRLFNPQGKIMEDLHFVLESIDNNSAVLYGLWQDNKLEIARCSFLTSEIIERREGYQPVLSEGAVQPANGKVMTLSFEGEFAAGITQNEGALQIASSLLKSGPLTNDSLPLKREIKIDGLFDDWRNIRGVSDPKGDFVSYLYLNPDTDLLQAKVSNDNQYLYLYSRVVGSHGRTGPKGRYYFYSYIDIDSNPKTGYPPTRDDNCYFGVAIGDDCEAQFEFIGNTFIKTFFGFTGAGAEKEVLNGQLKLGPSFYAPFDSQGKKRDRYKIEYVNRLGSRFITHDYTKGSSEDIIIALSPDGSEMEMRVELKGFLWDESGKQLVSKGQLIDISFGVEASSDAYGSDDWGADSTPVIYGYKIK